MRGDSDIFGDSTSSRLRKKVSIEFEVTDVREIIIDKII